MIAPQNSVDKPQGRSFRFHLLMVFCACVVLYMLFFVTLGWLTGHGQEVKVPSVTGKNLDAALSTLRSQGFDVKVDSAYEPSVKPFTVIGQQPEPNSVVKEGRILFLTVNKAEPLKTAMPNLIGLSYRSAILILKSNRLLLGDTTYKPDIAKGAILDQLINGQKVKPGQIIAQGSRIDLVIGDGLGQTEMGVPDLIGLSYMEALATIGAMGLQINAAFDGEISDSSSAVIYNQQPHAFNELSLQNMIHEGDIIDIFVKQHPSPEELEDNKKGYPGVKADSNALTD